MSSYRRTSVEWGRHETKCLNQLSRPVAAIADEPVERFLGLAPLVPDQVVARHHHVAGVADDADRG